MAKNCIKDSLDYYATIFTGLSAYKLSSASFSWNGRRPRRFSAVLEIYNMPFPWKLFPPWKYPNSVMYTLFGLDLWLRGFVYSSTLLQEAAASGARRLVNYWSDTCRKRNMRKRPQRHRSACTTNHRVRAVLHCNTPHNNRDSKQRTIFFRGKKVSSKHMCRIRTSRLNINTGTKKASLWRFIYAQEEGIS